MKWVIIGAAVLFALGFVAVLGLVLFPGTASAIPPPPPPSKGLLGGLLGGIL